nr:MAG TPA: hypothetical protein [Caudoviricetes sp.]
MAGNGSQLVFSSLIGFILETHILCVAAGQKIFNGFDFLALNTAIETALGRGLNIVFDFHYFTFLQNFRGRYRVDKQQIFSSGDRIIQANGLGFPAPLFSLMPNGRFHSFTGHSDKLHFLKIRKGKPPLHTQQIPEDHHIKPFRPVKALLIQVPPNNVDVVRGELGFFRGKGAFIEGFRQPHTAAHLILCWFHSFPPPNRQAVKPKKLLNTSAPTYSLNLVGLM